MKFLVVDDDPIILKLLTEILIGFGYDNVTRSKSAFDALREIEAQQEPFDCIMLDVQMPEMDGIELCRAIRPIAGYESVPIIMITVMQDLSYIRSAFAAGATDYTIKPFDVIELVERIRLADVVKEPEQARKMAMIRSKAQDASNTINNLVNRTALENFVRNCRTQKLILPAALTIKVSPSEGVSANSIANALVRMFRQTEIFVTYLGEGEALVVCDRFGAIPENVLKLRLRRELSQIYTGLGLPSDVEVTTGGWFSPRPYERASDMAFLDRAVADRSNGWWRKAKARKGGLGVR